jgi:hypothetical protein
VGAPDRQASRHPVVISAQIDSDMDDVERLAAAPTARR